MIEFVIVDFFSYLWDCDSILQKFFQNHSKAGLSVAGHFVSPDPAIFIAKNGFNIEW
jgi:hypothetical protein